MEYAVPIENNFDYLRYVGYQENGYNSLFSQNTINTISRKVTELTMGVDPQNRRIVVPNDSIIGVLNSIWENFVPNVGSIYSRYTIPSGENQSNRIQYVIDQTIEVLVSNIQTNYGMELSNSKLTVWTTVLGDHNEHGLRSHDIIKVSRKHPARMQFNMNY